MVDLRLLYPAEKLEAAARLADAIAAAGYRVEREALSDSGAFPDLAAEAGKARALLLIWSRGLVSAAMADGRLAGARRCSNLIEVSADGIEPASGEVSPVVLLCGWRGQPFHPGWQRILADMKRLCGPRDASAASGGDAASGPGLSPGKPIRRSIPGRPTVRAAVAAGALIAATLGAAAAFRGDAPDATPPAQSRQVLADPGTSPGGVAVGATAAAAAQPPVEAARPVSTHDTILAGATPAAATPVGLASAQAPSTERAASRKSVARQKSGKRRLAAATGREVKRYSRKYSKTMRLFCQRSGRSTPQCRTFARSTRHLRG